MTGRKLLMTFPVTAESHTLESYCARGGYATLEKVVHVPHSPESAVIEHRAVREAIGARDGDGARSAMREHLERVERDAEKGVRNG